MGAVNIGRILFVAIDAGDDLKLKLEELVRRAGISSATVWGIGSLKKAVLRNIKSPKKPAEITVTEIDGPLEILLQGNISTGISEEIDKKGEELDVHAHIHVVASKKNGEAFGGSLATGNMVWRQVEVIILELEGMHLVRMLNRSTGLPKLVPT